MKTCRQNWTTELRSPRGVADLRAKSLAALSCAPKCACGRDVAYAKNMPPACFLNAAGCPSGHTGEDEGSPRAETFFYRYPAPRDPSSGASRHLLPAGEGLRLRQPTTSARSAALQAEDDPNRRHPYKASAKSLPDHPVLVTTKGVLRTLVLSEFLVTFCSSKKSPAGGKTPIETPSARTEQTSLRQKEKTSARCRL